MVTKASEESDVEQARTAHLEKRRSSARSLWRKIHLGLALSVGGLFAFLSVTGSFLVFYNEIDAFLNPGLLTRQSEVPQNLPLASLVDLVDEEFGTVRRVDLAAGSSEVHRMQVFSESEPSAYIEVTVDPASGEILGSRPWREHLVSLVYDLHYTLLAGRTGRDVTGYVGLALFVSIGSGLYLWWPRQGGFAKAFRIKRKAPGFRRFYDIHKGVGLPAVVFLSISAFSGIAMQFPETTRTAVGWFLPEARGAGGAAIQLRSLVAGVGLRSAIASAKGLVPDGRVRRIQMPKSDANYYRIFLRRPGEVRRSGGLNIVQIDAASGAVTASRLARDFSATDWVMAWQFSLHNGEAAGVVGRWLVVCLGFAPLALWLTGIGIWWKKRQTQQRRRAGLLSQQNCAES